MGLKISNQIRPDWFPTRLEAENLKQLFIGMTNKYKLYVVVLGAIWLILKAGLKRFIKTIGSI